MEVDGELHQQGCRGNFEEMEVEGCRWAWRGRTMAVIKSVDNEAIISVVPNLPVTSFI
jgi:hypothetical protein